MAIDLKQFELNRIVNMLKSMDWTIVSSGFQGDKVVVTFEKTVTGMYPELKKVEGDRITNMLKSFTWAVVGAEYPENKIVLKFEKVVKGEVG